MPKANPKMADENPQDIPEITVKDSVAPKKEAPKPVKSETKEVNGVTMTFEDY